MTRRCLPALCLVVLGCASGPSAQENALAHRAADQVLPVLRGSIRELRFAKTFRYVGGQRFILKKVADAEQHFFVETSNPGTVRRLYWVQFENLLPGMGDGYDYSSDVEIPIAGIPFRRNFWRWDNPPDPDSDRAAMFRFLEARGYRIPNGAVRMRFVHVPEGNRREELMIVYAEAPAPGDPSPPRELDVQRRALEGLSVVAEAQ